MNLTTWLALQRGRQAALAAYLHIKPPQVAAWAVGKKQVPLDHCPFIQNFTGGAVTCEELRPDAVEYFALIRAQHACATALPTGIAIDRRDPSRPSPYTGTDIDRRAPPGAKCP